MASERPGWYVDDLTIGGDVRLLRRVHPAKLLSGPEPDSSLFKVNAGDHGISCTLWLSPDDEKDALRGHETEGLRSITAAVVRSLNLGIVRVPIEGNPNHCEIFGSINKPAQRSLRSASRWVRYPDSYAHPPVEVEPF